MYIIYEYIDKYSRKTYNYIIKVKRSGSVKKSKKVYGLLLTIFMICMTMVSPVAAGSQVSDNQNNKETAAVENQKKTNESKKSGWFKKGKYKYYRMKNGKLCTKKYVKINGKYYSFDSKGRMRTGLITFSEDDKVYFSKTKGHMVNFVKVMNVERKYKDSVVGKDSSGGLYDVTLKKIVDKNNKVISASKLKKGSKIYVLYKGGMQESYPMQFQNAYKIKLIA